MVADAAKPTSIAGFARADLVGLLLGTAADGFSVAQAAKRRSHDEVGAVAQKRGPVSTVIASLVARPALEMAESTTFPWGIGRRGAQKARRHNKGAEVVARLPYTKAVRQGDGASSPCCGS